MIKKSIFTMLFITVLGWVSAQSLQFEWDGHVYAEGETIECTNDEYGYGEFIQHMQLRNLTSGDLNVIVEKEVVSDLEGTTNFFCWGSCFGPDVYVSPNPVMVAANSVTGEGELSLHVLFDPEVFGKVEVKYSAYDRSNISERVTINVVFNKSGEGLNNPSAVRFGRAYQEVMNLPMNTLQDRLSFSVSELNDGIYFCNLFVNGCAVKTEKFVVKK